MGSVAFSELRASAGEPAVLMFSSLGGSSREGAAAAKAEIELASEARANERTRMDFMIFLL